MIDSMWSDQAASSAFLFMMAEYETSLDEFVAWIDWDSRIMIDWDGNILGFWSN